MLIGAGAKILGNIEVGHCARIAAGSVVLKPVPHNVTVAGVPAKVIGEAGCAEPSRTMDQMFSENLISRRRPGAQRFAVENSQTIDRQRALLCYGSASHHWRRAVDVQEIRKLDAYLKKLFGNATIRVVPKKQNTAEIFVGEDYIGELTVDDEDGERSYNVRMVIQLGRDPSIQPVPALNAYLRRKFGNENIRVVTRPKKTDSLEAYLGEEFLGVLFAGT